MASRYKSFLKLCKEWPVNESRLGRDLGEILHKRVKEVFPRGDITKVSEEDVDRIGV